MNLRNFRSPLAGYQLSLPLPPPGPSEVSFGPAPRAPVTLAPASRAPLVAAPEGTDGLSRSLATLLGEPVVVEIHDNRSTMVSYRRRRGRLAVRLHRMFLPPAEELSGVLAGFIVGRGARRASAGRWLDRFIREHQAAIRPARPPAPLNPQGRTRNLQEVYQALNARYFGGAMVAEIGWGQLPRKKRRRSIRMGVYFHEARQIRLHPALDRPEVPDYLVEFVVYHEMCHQACPPEPGRGTKKRIHTPSFRARERLHPDRARALAWEKAHLKLLLRSRPE